MVDSMIVFPEHDMISFPPIEQVIFGDGSPNTSRLISKSSFPSEVLNTPSTCPKVGFLFSTKAINRSN